MRADDTPARGRLLDVSTVGTYLAGRGVLPPGPSRARALAGGVSSVVFLVESGDVRVVVKQALARLRVADDWRADPARAQGEAAALRLLHRLTPAAVPEVLDEDPEAHTVTLAAAPPGWVDWKQRLLAGDVDPSVAGRVGELAGQWHRATAGAALPAVLEHNAALDELRIVPYFRTAGRRRPALAPVLDARVAGMAERRECLVSGDLSPKNVLVGPGSGPTTGDRPAAQGERALWVIDLEVAHRGDPAFDVAFMVTHLLLKAVHLPRHRPALRACLGRFLDGYGTGPGTRGPAHLRGLVACLLLARVVGASPAEYLRPREAGQVERAAASLLRDHHPNAGASGRTLRPRATAVAEGLWARVVGP